MMKATIHTEISPIVGTEKQSEDLARSLLAGFEDDPEKLWESNIFGKSLHELVNEGLQNKLLHMPQEARTRLQETLERVINEGCTADLHSDLTATKQKREAPRGCLPLYLFTFLLRSAY